VVEVEVEVEVEEGWGVRAVVVVEAAGDVTTST